MPENDPSGREEAEVEAEYEAETVADEPFTPGLPPLNPERQETEDGDDD